MPDALLPTAAEFDVYLESIRRLVREVLIPGEPRLDGAETLPDDLTQRLREIGLFGISIPTRWGGLGLSMEQQVRVMFEVTRASAVYRARFSTTIGLGSQPILYNGTDAQRAEWLPRMASGEVTAAFALTEPEAGSDAGGLRTTARRDGDCYVLNGSKRYITNARQAGSRPPCAVSTTRGCMWPSPASARRSGCSTRRLPIRSSASSSGSLSRNSRWCRGTSRIAGPSCSPRAA